MILSEKFISIACILACIAMILQMCSGIPRYMSHNEVKQKYKNKKKEITCYNIADIIVTIALPILIIGMILSKQGL